MHKIPTGVADLDSVIKGGVPAGSVIILLGEVGAGQTEFAYTSAARTALMKQHPHLKKFLIGDSYKNATLPDRISYITFCKSKQDIMREVSDSFEHDLAGAFKELLVFRDFSAHYFRHSVVPSSWSSDHTAGINTFLDKKEPNGQVLESFVDFIDHNATKSMLIVDSLTDLVANKYIDPLDLVTVLRGMQRAAKRWNGLIYLILTKGAVDAQIERMLIDSVDGVIRFEWGPSLKTSKRQRYMYFEKFMSVLMHLDRERISRFAVDINSESGFVVSNYLRV